ncbi:hypothetical protein [Undibacterium sp. Xuan67W]|uniref:hypothetical protein n=1 Tax=Undibacterium sp. Xuan67W TaxID=3413057 RepID=UPI003BF11EB4
MAHKKPVDPNGKHIRIYCTLLNSPAYRVLSFSAIALYFALRSLLNGSNNGDVSAVLPDLRHKGFTSSATISRALYELRVMGFIAVTRMGGLKQKTRVCTLYRFTDLEVFSFPKKGIQPMKATHDYMKFQSVRDAEIALRDGVELLIAEGRKKQLSKQGRKNIPVQNLNCISSITEPKDKI